MVFTQHDHIGHIVASFSPFQFKNILDLEPIIYYFPDMIFASQESRKTKKIKIKVYCFTSKASIS